MIDVAKPDAVADLDPALVRLLEETLLFGKLDEAGALLDQLIDDERLPVDLRYGLDSLRYFRAHYAAEAARLTEEQRRQVIRYDADWTMQLIQLLHRRHFGIADKPSS